MEHVTGRLPDSRSFPMLSPPQPPTPNPQKKSPPQLALWPYWANLRCSVIRILTARSVITTPREVARPRRLRSPFPPETIIYCQLHSVYQTDESMGLAFVNWSLHTARKIAAVPPMPPVTPSPNTPLRLAYLAGPPRQHTSRIQKVKNKARIIKPKRSATAVNVFRAG